MALSIFAVICGTIAIVLMWKRPKTRRTQAVLMLVVGLSLAGAGWIGRAQGWLAQHATDASTSLTSRIFGVGVAYAIALFIVLWWAFDMDLDGLVNKIRKKGGGSGKHGTTALTPWLSLMVPVSLAVLPIVGSIPVYLREAATTAASAIGS